MEGRLPDESLEYRGYFFLDIPLLLNPRSKEARNKVTVNMMPKPALLRGAVVTAVLLSPFILAPNILSDDDQQGRNSGKMDDRRTGADRLVDENARKMI